MLYLGKDAVATATGEYPEETYICLYDGYGNILSLYTLGTSGGLYEPINEFLKDNPDEKNTMFCVQSGVGETFFKFVEAPVEPEPVKP